MAFGKLKNIDSYKSHHKQMMKYLKKINKKRKNTIKEFYDQKMLEDSLGS